MQCIYFLTRDPEDAIDHFPFPSLLTFNLKKQELTLSFLLPFPSSLPFLPSLFHLPGETERDATIYLGSLGNSYFYWKLSRYYKKQENTEKWQEALKIAISIFENSPLDTLDSERDVSFYLGLPGAHALGSILYFDSGDMKKGKSYVNRLFARFKKPFDHQGLCELLMGLTGYMSCILFLFKYCPTPAPFSSSKALDILRACFKLVFTNNGASMDVSNRTANATYFGASHGLSGILHCLLFISDLAKEEPYKSTILKNLEYLLQNQKDGMFKTISGEDLPEIYQEVQWCHGSPGIIPTLLYASKLYNEEKFYQAAVQAAELVWERGLVYKGFNLCHGICGNAYAFLAMYQHAKEEKYLLYAYQFCYAMTSARVRSSVNTFKDPVRMVVGEPDHPHSLMEGIAGEGCYLIDMLSPLEASFPGFDADWMDTQTFLQTKSRSSRVGS